MYSFSNLKNQNRQCTKTSIFHCLLKVTDEIDVENGLCVT